MSDIHLSENISMASKQTQQEFEKFVNFRCIEGLQCSDGSKIKPGMIYRSARPDNMTAKDCKKFGKLGIRTLLNMRRLSEFKKAKGDKSLMNQYQSFYWKNGEYKHFKTKSKVSDFPEKKHLLISVFSLSLIWEVMCKVNFLIRFPSLLLALIDKIFGTYFFVVFYAKLVVNKANLASQYFRMMEHTKPAIFAALKVFCDESNLPVLIHCSQGKDRTGVITMLVLSSLGVEESEIIWDYAKSEQGLLRVREHTVREVVGKYGFSEDFTHAYPDTMIELFQKVKKIYGSVFNYLDNIGFDQSYRNKLKQVLTE